MKVQAWLPTCWYLEAKFGCPLRLCREWAKTQTRKKLPHMATMLIPWENKHNKLMILLENIWESVFLEPHFELSWVNNKSQLNLCWVSLFTYFSKNNKHFMSKFVQICSHNTIFYTILKTKFKTSYFKKNCKYYGFQKGNCVSTSMFLCWK